MGCYSWSSCPPQIPPGHSSSEPPPHAWICHRRLVWGLLSSAPHLSGLSAAWKNREIQNGAQVAGQLISLWIKKKKKEAIERDSGTYLLPGKLAQIALVFVQSDFLQPDSDGLWGARHCSGGGWATARGVTPATLTLQRWGGGHIRGRQWGGQRGALQWWSAGDSTGVGMPAGRTLCLKAQYNSATAERNLAGKTELLSFEPNTLQQETPEKGARSQAIHDNASRTTPHVESNTKLGKSNGFYKHQRKTHWSWTISIILTTCSCSMEYFHFHPATLSTEIDKMQEAQSPRQQVLMHHNNWSVKRSITCWKHQIKGMTWRSHHADIQKRAVLMMNG